LGGFSSAPQVLIVAVADDERDAGVGVGPRYAESGQHD
jgi:hypothetical protein